MPDLTIRPVQSESDLQAFLRFPWTVYKNDPIWTPPLWAEHVKYFDPAHNIELQHIDFEKFIAWRGDHPAGTVIAHINHAYNDFQKKKVGWFGQFEVLEDQEAAHALLQTTLDWVKARGCDTLMGPATFSTNSEIGLLIEGFDQPQQILTSHARPYYQGFVEESGFEKSMDLWCWYLDARAMGGTRADRPPEKLARVAEKVRQRKHFSVRPVDMKHLPDEVEKVKVIYNQAWAQNWGFVPMSDPEIDKLARDLKDMIDPAIALFVEVEGQPVAFALPLPDVYQALKKAQCQPGEPEWWQLARLLWHWKIAGRITRVRVWALGVLEQYRGAGVDVLLYAEMLRRGLPRGYRDIEMSWILENNHEMNAILRMAGATIYKTYRVYQRSLRNLSI